MLFLYLLFSLFPYCIPALKCYDCTDCPYPWSSLNVNTYGSITGLLSRVQSCYKKEFYNSFDRRLDRVARGALDGECRAGKLETLNERSITYCCYSSYCNGTVPQLVVNYLINILAILVMFIVNE